MKKKQSKGKRTGEMWREEFVRVSLAYQTHGEGWRLGAGADVDLHIQHQASGGCMLGVCVCVH